MKRLLQDIRHLIWCLKRPLRCQLGFHADRTIEEWGFGGAVIDWYCSRCQTLIASTPLDDVSDELKAEIEKRWGSPIFDGAVQFGVTESSTGEKE